VAKKVRPKTEEEAAGFEFPVFDEHKFVHHEFEQTMATLIAFGLSMVLAVASYLLGRLNLTFVLPLIAGLAGIVFSPSIVQRLRPLASEYTRGEWAGLILLELFGWLGVWFLLTDIFH
jgi:hypothetical protein